MGGIVVCKAALHWSEWGNGGKEGGKVTAKAFMAEGSIIQNTSEEEHCFHSIALSIVLLHGWDRSLQSCTALVSKETWQQKVAILCGFHPYPKGYEYQTRLNNLHRSVERCHRLLNGSTTPENKLNTLQ